AEAEAELKRIDGQAGSVAGTFAYLPAENRLDLRIKGGEPAGGVVAKLLRLPGDPAIEFTADGSGPLSDWAGKASFMVDGAEAARVSARHQAVADGSRIEASGEGAFAPFLPASVADIARGTTRFTFSGTLG